MGERGSGMSKEEWVTTLVLRSQIGSPITGLVGRPEPSRDRIGID